MYHIPNDKRAKQSAELLYNALKKCISKKSFERVTVTDLQKESGVARTTFYRLYDNISDILYHKCDNAFHEALSITDLTEIYSEYDIAERYFTYWIEHSDILRLLIDINRQDIIYYCHSKNAEALEQSYGKLPDNDEITAKYFIPVRTALTVGVLTTWLKGGKKETVEEIMQILKKQIYSFI